MMLFIVAKFQIKKVLTVMDFSGRIDHILSQINTLFKACDFLRGIDVYLMTKNCLSWLLCPGQHHIIIPEKFVNAQLWCSFIPVGSSTKVTTEGLKWNLCEYLFTHQIVLFFRHLIIIYY